MWVGGVTCPARDAIDAAVQTLDSELAPIDDIRSTSRYRRRVAANLTIEFLQRLRTA